VGYLNANEEETRLSRFRVHRLEKGVNGWVALFGLAAVAQESTPCKPGFEISQLSKRARLVWDVLHEEE
jgi:hypothetical protein